MPLATGQKAFMAARLGVMRLGASRLGYIQPWIKVLINGTDRTGETRLSDCTITDELNHEPNTATVRVSGFTPVKGQEIKVYMGDTTADHQLFGGRILSVDQTYEAQKPSEVVWVCQCIDYTWLLNRQQALKKYANQTATAIVLDLMSTYTSGFTTTHVATGLATLDEITFTNEDVTDALTRIAERIGGYWYIDYASDLHFFVTETATAAAITQTVPRGMSGIVQGVDLSQVATRVTARGGGSNASSDVPVGSTTIPVEDTLWYAAAGGTVEVGTNRATYTGVVAGADVAPPATVVVSVSDFHDGNLDPSAIYGYAFTWLTAAGESLPSTTVYGGPTNANRTLQVDYIPVPTDAAVTSKNIYRTEGGGTTLKLFGNTSNSLTQMTDVNSDVLLGATAPVTDTSGLSPSSTPELTGVTGIVHPIKQGDPVNIVVTVNDTTAQTAMAGFVGGDGIHAMFISDGRWSITEATARATAELTLRKDPLTTVTFKSRDQTIQSGRDVTITLSSPSISGTFKIQRVTLTQLGLSGPTGWLFPLRQVEASSRRYSFEDVLRRIKT